MPEGAKSASCELADAQHAGDIAAAGSCRLSSCFARSSSAKQLDPAIPWPDACLLSGVHMLSDWCSRAAALTAAAEYLELCLSVRCKSVDAELRPSNAAGGISDCTPGCNTNGSV